MLKHQSRWFLTVGKWLFLLFLQHECVWQPLSPQIVQINTSWQIILNLPHILCEIKYGTKKKLLEVFVAALFISENNMSPSIGEWLNKF